MTMNVLRLDAIYRGAFQEPAHGFLGGFPALYEAIYRRFSPLIRPEEIKWEGGTQPSDFLTVCNAVALGFAVRYRLTEVEGWTNRPDLIRAEKVWPDLIERSASVPRDIRADAAFSSHTFTVAAHWEIPEGSTFDRYIAGWEGPHPSGFGLAGISFVSTTEGPPVTIEFQPSLLFRDPGHGFVRVTCELPGATEIREACTTAQQAILGALKRFELDLGIS